MDIEQFDRMLLSARAKKPFYYAADNEGPCSAEEISALEATLGLSLPDAYIQYLAKYGGGYIGSISVFSAVANSEWYLPKCNRLIPSALNFIAATDDGTGGYYGFIVADRRCGESVYFWAHDDGADPKVMAPTFLDYLVAAAELEAN